MAIPRGGTPALMRRRPEDSYVAYDQGGMASGGYGGSNNGYYGSGAYGGPTNRRPDAARSAEASRQFYEEENNNKIAELSSQVSMLRELTIDIGTEVRTQNSLLDDMGGGFNKADGLMGTTMRRLNTMLSSTSGRHMMGLMGFIVLAFFAIYWIVRAK